eukprot:SAG11_NODE_3927_length_2144_cov_13.208802_2_plen_265_part_00
MSPYYVEHGRHPIMKLDTVRMDDRDIVAHKGAGDFIARIQSIDQEVHERMLLTRQYAEKHFNKKVREANALLVPGAYAWLSSEGITMPWDKNRPSAKLKAKYYGPFKILEQLGLVTFRLSIPTKSKIHDVFHVALLKPVHGSNVDKMQVEKFPQAEQDAEYVVEEILARREDPTGTQYLVKWEGYMYEDSTWEPEINLRQCRQKVAQFERKYKRPSRHEDPSTLEYHVQAGHDADMKFDTRTRAGSRNEKSDTHTQKKYNRPRH